MDTKIMMDPEKYGYKECDHCNGYGSSFKDPEGVDRCTKCGGGGLVKNIMKGGESNAIYSKMLDTNRDRGTRNP